MNLTSKTVSLVFLARFNPQMWDALIPHSPYISEGTRHLMASMLIKSIAKEVTDSNIAMELHRVGKSLFDAGSKSMIYDDELFPHPPGPTWLADLLQFGPHPEPLAWNSRAWMMLNPQPLPPIYFWEQVMLNPQPLPPRYFWEQVMLNPQPLPPKKQAYYGALVTLLADAVSFENTPEVLRNIGNSLMRQSSETKL